MTIDELNRISASTLSGHAGGWTASVFLHLLGIVAAMYFVVEIQQPVLEEPFRWEISMVDAPVHTEPESKPLEQQMQPISPPVRPKPPVRRTTQPSVAPTPVPTHTEANVPTEATPMQREVIEQAEPVTEYSTVASSETHMVPTQEVREQPVPSPEPQLLSPVQQSEPTEVAVEQRIVQQKLVHYRKTQADYGWLREMLWKRIEELKHYPRVARDNHWEGRVVVQAVIKADGTVGALSVAESSGHVVLDEEALMVMRKASPLTLTHQLEKAQITILVPISYHLEG